MRSIGCGDDAEAVADIVAPGICRPIVRDLFLSKRVLRNIVADSEGDEIVDAVIFVGILNRTSGRRYYPAKLAQPIGSRTRVRLARTGTTRRRLLFVFLQAPQRCSYRLGDPTPIAS